ncbi:LSM11 [Scenedesmus sp. PABB004]|nr:LSM11 [Scenedesmus sp. PABB004]
MEQQRAPPPPPPGAEPAGGPHPPESALDFTSPAFDAAAALAATDLQPPVPGAPLLDNVSKCAALLPPEAGGPTAAPAAPTPAEVRAAARSAGSGAAAARPRAPAPARARPPPPTAAGAARARRAEQEQERAARRAKAAALKARAAAAAARAEASVAASSLGAIMSRAAVGPLAPLARWAAEGRRVLVVTRHAAGVRGRAVGVLRGFDKHLNLLLADVEESYTVMSRVRRERGGARGAEQQQARPLEQEQLGQQQQGQQQQGQQQQELEQLDLEQQQGQQGQQQPGQQAAPARGGPRPRARWCRKQEHRFRRLEQVLIVGDSVVLLASEPPLALAGG